jgi:5-methyltetrahydropteroyltriglutamate--homocysteine methyltransferase
MARWRQQPLLTTVVGSYPVGDLPPRRAVQRAVEEQIAAGIELIADGQVRGDMIETFAARIPGFARADDGVWEVVDELKRPEMPITVSDFALARRLAAGRAAVKAIVTGPVTLALAARLAPDAPYAAPHDPDLIVRLGEIVAHEVAALVSAGAEVVQVDEPTLGRALGALVAPELAERALRDLALLPVCPVLHVCGDVRAIAQDLLALPFAVFDLEGCRVDNLSAVDPDELEFADARLSYGCVDSAAADVEPVAVVRARVEAAARAIPPKRLWIAPDCGLRLLAPEVARAKLNALVAAVQAVRATL